jgi:hypothetical protein
VGIDQALRNVAYCATPARTTSGSDTAKAARSMSPARPDRIKVRLAHRSRETLEEGRQPAV